MWHSPTWIFSAIASLLISSESGVRVEPRNWLALIECQASFFRRERKKSMHICVKSAEAELGKCPASDMRLCIQAVMLSIVRRYIQ